MKKRWRVEALGLMDTSGERYLVDVFDFRCKWSAFRHARALQALKPLHFLTALGWLPLVAYSVRRIEK